MTRNRFLTLRMHNIPEHITFVYLYKVHVVDIILTIDEVIKKTEKMLNWDRNVVFSVPALFGATRNVRVLLPKEPLVFPLWLSAARDTIIMRLSVPQPHEFVPHVTSEKDCVSGQISRLSLMVGDREKQVWEI